MTTAEVMAVVVDALRFYGEENNYIQVQPTPDSKAFRLPVLRDCGKIAREALAKLLDTNPTDS